MCYLIPDEAQPVRSDKTYGAPGEIELTTSAFRRQRSIQLSYGCRRLVSYVLRSEAYINAG